MFIASLNLSYQAKAQGDLLITPVRVVFEGNKQKADLNLVNTGKDTATYSISFRHYNMTEQGNLVLNEKYDTAQMFSDQYIRIFPRSVTLSPGEGQIIILQCRRKADMKAGEYRSHLWFRSEKNYEPLEKDKPVLDSNQLSVTITPIFGITIPVIIRSGEVNLSSSLSNLKLETLNDTLQLLNLTINRAGNISIYGNLIVEFIPVKGKPYEIGKTKGIGVYTDISKRNVSIKLNVTQGMALKNGKILVRFTSPDASKYIQYAQGELVFK
jgi:hypothetical protein